MARKTKTVIIPTGDGKTNRDAGKAFKLTEFDAMRAEKWATRALLAISAAGIDIPPEVMRMGAGAVLAAGMRALVTMSFHDAEPLLDDMLSCIEFVPVAREPDFTRPLDREDIEEVSTLIKLRDEVIELHTGFSVAAFLSKMGAAANNPTPDFSVTETSPNPSAT